MHAANAAPTPTPAPTEQQQRIIDELSDWAIVTGRPLPYPAEAIARLETAGFVVDLADGSIQPAEPIIAQRISPTPKGRTVYATARQEKERAR